MYIVKTQAIATAKNFKDFFLSKLSTWGIIKGIAMTAEYKNELVTTVPLKYSKKEEVNIGSMFSKCAFCIIRSIINIRLINIK